LSFWRDHLSEFFCPPTENLASVSRAKKTGNVLVIIVQPPAEIIGCQVAKDTRVVGKLAIWRVWD